MSTTKAKKSKPAENPPAIVEERSKSLWSLHGMEDVYFQREAQVNFWTVMGGLQLAALLTQLGALWEQMQMGRWYLSLYLLASLLIVALMWASTAWGSLILKWTINIPNIITATFGNFAMAIACLLIADPAGWFISLAFAATANWMVQFQFYRLGAWVSFSADMTKQFKTNLRIYILWPLVCFAGAIHLFLAPSAMAEGIWGAIILVVVINGLYRQHQGMKREKKELGIP